MPPTTAIIDDDARSFVTGPVSMLYGSTDPMRTPDLTRCAGIASLGGNRLRVLLCSVATDAHANSVLGARCTLLVSNITTYRSLQWKGIVVKGIEPRTSGDLALFHRHMAAFAAGAPLVGIPTELVDPMFPVEVVALEVEVDAAFDQSPGHGAGRQVG